MSRADVAAMARATPGRIKRWANNLAGMPPGAPRERMLRDCERDIGPVAAAIARRRAEEGRAEIQPIGGSTAPAPRRSTTARPRPRRQPERARPRPRAVRGRPAKAHAPPDDDEGSEPEPPPALRDDDRVERPEGGS